MKEDRTIVATLGDKLKSIIEERGISGRKLAALCHHPVMTINDILNGRKTPRWNVVVDIADVLGISTDELRPPRRKKKTA